MIVSSFSTRPAILGDPVLRLYHPPPKHLTGNLLYLSQKVEKAKLTAVEFELRGNMPLSIFA